MAWSFFSPGMTSLKIDFHEIALPVAAGHLLVVQSGNAIYTFGESETSGSIVFVTKHTKLAGLTGAAAAAAAGAPVKAGFSHKIKVPNGRVTITLKRCIGPPASKVGTATTASRGGSGAPASEGPPFGFRATFTLDGAAPDAARLLPYRESAQSRVDSAVLVSSEANFSQWTRQMDSLLMRCAVGYATAKLKRPTMEMPAFPPPSLPTEEAAKAVKEITDLCPGLMLADVRQRYRLIHSLNAIVAELSPILGAELRVVEEKAMVDTQRLAFVMFSDQKQKGLQEAIKGSATSDSDLGTLSLDNKTASYAREGSPTGPSTSALEASKCIFVQLWNHLKKAPGAQLRNSRSDEALPFSITYVNEPGLDGGGLFRDAVTQAVQDLFHPHFNLLIRVRGHGGGEEKSSYFVPNTSVPLSPTAISMFIFAGRLLAMSIRYKLFLPFAFPPLIYAALVRGRLTLEDVADVDGPSVATFQAMRAYLDEEGATPTAGEEGVSGGAAFPEHYFQVRLASGVMEELIPGGAEVLVTPDNCERFLEAAERVLCHQFDAQVDVIRKGLGNNIPLSAFTLFTGSELEDAICGSRVVETAWLKENTSYENCNAEHPVVKLFWQAFGELTNEERGNWIIFSFGQSKISPRPVWLHKRKHTIKLTSASRSQLPGSHTCYFTVDMPQYDTLERMRQVLHSVTNYGFRGMEGGR